MEGKHTRIIDETFAVKKTLGMGFTSEVILAEHLETGFKLAIKIFKPIKHFKLMIDNFRKEVESMKNLKHENLINVIAANESGVMMNEGNKSSIMYIGVELAENAELFDYIADPGKAFSEPCARHFFKQLVSGLKFMHDQGVAHRDLKTENLFLNSDFTLKIGDFGFSKFMNPEVNLGMLKTVLGTSGYQCPEMLEGQYYSGSANDVFAIGVILFILTKAYPPFREAKKTDLWYRYLYYEKFENFWQSHSKRGHTFSKELQELIQGTLRYKNRWTLEDIIQCEWFKGETPSNESFLEEMNSRKLIVDARRDHDAREALKASNNKSENVIMYRGEDEKENFKIITKRLIDLNAEQFVPKIWDKHNTRYLLSFQGTNVYENYKNLLELIISESGEVNLSEDDFFFTAALPIKDSSIHNPDNENDCITTCGFSSQFYADYDTDKTYVELIKDRNTDIFSFKSIIDILSPKDE